MQETVEEIHYRNHVIKVYQDEDSCDPRLDNENFGRMVCLHRRYQLGDKHYMDIEEAMELEKSKDVISLPLYLYDHSGITMSTSPFSCPWDSGKVGFIYVTKEKVRKEYEVKLVTKKTREKVISILESEVEEYNDYITGNVYGYVIWSVDDDGNELEEKDSCWGFFGDYEKYMIPDCKQMIDYYVEKDACDKIFAQLREIGECKTTLE